MSALYFESSISHHGIKGQRWGFRRYQNADGSLTAAGRKRQQNQMNRISRKENKAQRKIAKENLKVQEKLKTAEAAAKLQADKDRLAELTSKKKSQSSGSQESSGSIDRKHISNLSDSELMSLIDRVRLEQRYSELIASSKQDKDKSKVASFLAQHGSKYIDDLGSQLNKAISTALINKATHKNEMEKMDKEAAKVKAAADREDYKYQRDIDREDWKWRRDAARDNLKWNRDTKKAFDMENLKWENQQKTANATWARKHFDDFIKNNSSKSYAESKPDYSNIVDVDENYVNPYANRNANGIMVIDPWRKRIGG